MIKRRKKYFQYSLWLLLSCLLSFLARGQNPQDLSPPEIHALVEKYINYSRDSSYILLELASEKIEKITDPKLAKVYRAENNLRRADYWLFHSYNVDTSLYFLENAHRHYRKHPDNKRLADIHILRAQINRVKRRIGRPEKPQVLPYIDSAVMYAKDLKDPAFLSFLYYERANSLQFEELWEDSFVNAILCLKNAESSNDSLSLATAYFLMGKTHHHFGLFNSSESFLAKSIEYGEKLAGLYSIMHIHADVILLNNKPELALKGFKEVLEIAIVKNDFEKAKTICADIGQILLDKEDVEGAKIYYSKLTSILGSTKPEGYKTLLFMAQMKFLLGDEEGANEYLNSFGSRYNQGSIIPRSVDVFKQAGDLHMALNQKELASQYYKKWGFLKDSLYSHTSKQQLNALEEMYLKEKEKNEEILRKNKELDLSRSQQAIMAGVLILVILVGSGLLYSIRMKGLKENQSLKYSLKERQIEQMIGAQENERQRLGRELHDGIGQSLAALKMQLQFDKDPKASTTTVERIDHICEEVRSLSHQMMPLVLKENGLESAVEQLLDHNFSASPIEIDFVSSGLNGRLSDKVEVNVYRIIQELVSNILRHSEASKAGVQLLKRRKKLLLIVEDNGKGFSPGEKSIGMGLGNINVRLESLNGEAQIQSSPQKGTYIHISIPLKSYTNKKTA